jgi:glutamate-1-semialdehyde aminotransferase
MATHGASFLDLDRVWALKAAEDERFVAERPRSAELLARGRASMPEGVPNVWFWSNYDHSPVYVEQGKGAYFTDVDGHCYLDMMLGISCAFCGHAPEPVAEAIARQARRGSAFQLPVEDALWVAEELSRRFAPLRWQFALSASQAITDCIRLARAHTGRPKVLKFDANYHGHVDQTLVILEDGQVTHEYRGLPQESLQRTKVIQFNDAAALEAALADRDVACVIAEPAMTNIGFVLPQPGYHQALRRITRETGTLLLIDETQTVMCGHGGLTREYGLESDLFVVGKSIGGGVPFAAYGMNHAVASQIEAPRAAYNVSGAAVDEVATGGTMWANAISVAAARAVLEHLLTEPAYAHARALGSRLVHGIQDTIVEAGLPWSTFHFYTKSGFTFSPALPSNAEEARAADIPGVKDALNVYFANRGIWDGGWWAGPAVSIAHTEDHVDHYVHVFSEFLREVVT